MEEKLSTLGQRLRAARMRRHLSQTKVADLIGITFAAVGQWERDEAIPTLDNLVAVAELYGSSLDWLAWGGEMGSGIEARIRKIPEILRPALIERLHQEIDQTEEAAKRLPKEMAAQPVKDADKRLAGWSAKNLRKRPRAEKTSRGGGTQ